MMNSLYGKPVFPGSTRGRVVFWDSYRGAMPDTVLVAPFLSNNVAIRIVRDRIKAVVTESGSFATHGANLIRSFCAGGHPLPIWITDVDGACSILRTGSQVVLRSDGQITAPYITTNNYHSTNNEYYQSRPTYEVTRFSLKTQSFQRLYWPNRKYDVLTASLMIPGLQECCEYLSGKNCKVTHGKSGYLWFSNTSPSVNELRQLALNPVRARNHFIRQQKTYDMILDRLRMVQNANYLNNLRDISRYIDKNFSVLLLYHSTYENVLASAANLFYKISKDKEFVNDLMNLIMTSKLIHWQLGENIICENRKDIFEDTSALPLPFFNVSDDLLEVEDKIKYITKLINKQGHTITSKELSYIRYTCRVFVLKEWKFYINKLLYSRFGAISKLLSTKSDNCQLKNLEQWRIFPIDQLLRKLGI